MAHEGNRYAASPNYDRPLYKLLPERLKEDYRWRPVSDLALQCLLNESARSKSGNFEVLKQYHARYDKRTKAWQQLESRRSTARANGTKRAAANRRAITASVQSDSVKKGSQPTTRREDSAATNIACSRSSAVPETLSA